MVVSRRLALGASIVVVAALAVCLDLRSAPGTERPSQCLGRVNGGSLVNGWKLPRSGPNFEAYSTLGWSLSRTYVHSEVYGIVLAAYEDLQASHPELRFLYGETGWRSGGRFRPHRTHQTGTSVDFMTPVRDEEGEPAVLPVGLSNKWGYGIDFDQKGVWQRLTLDFEAVALHLAALRRAARDRGVPIAKVVFYPPFRKRLEATASWGRISDLPFTTREAWVRHDDHYHVDFGVRCE